MTAKKQVIRGFSNIHFAPFADGEFGTPVKLQGAKSGEFKLNFEHDPSYADDGLFHDGYLYTGGEGNVNVLELTPDEQALILGNKKVKGGVVVNSNDTAPNGAFLFEKKFKNSTDRRLYVVYNCICSNPGLTMQTIEDKAEDSVCEIPLSVSELDSGDVYFYIDTNDPTVDQTQVSNWYTEVQKPTELEVSSLESINEKSKVKNNKTK